MLYPLSYEGGPPQGIGDERVETLRDDLREEREPNRLEVRQKGCNH